MIDIKKVLGAIKREGSRKFLFNTWWLVLDKVLHMVLSLIIYSITAKYLGPQRYGMISYGMSFITIFTVICKLGIDSIIVNEMIKAKENTGKIMGTTIFLRLASGLLSIGIISVIVRIIKPGEPVLLLITAIQSVSLMFVAFDTIDFWFQSHLKSKYSSIAKSISYILVCAWRFILVMLKANVEMFAISTVIDSAAMAVMLLIFYYKNKGDKLRVSFPAAKGLLIKSRPFIISSLLIMVYTQMDRIMLGSMINDNQASVGIYTAAMNIANMWVFVPTAMIDSARPIIMKLKSGGEEEAYRIRYRQLMCAVIWMNIAVSLIFTFGSGLVISILYDAAYKASGPVLVVLMWSRLFSLIGLSTSVWIVCEGREKYVKYFAVIGALLNLGLNTVLIPIIGPLGAALATLATEVVASVIAVAFFKKTRPLFKIMGEAFLFRKLN